jgi:hypothetical protein
MERVRYRTAGDDGTGVKMSKNFNILRHKS